jgi:hypothetical protein
MKISKVGWHWLKISIATVAIGMIVLFAAVSLGVRGFQVGTNPIVWANSADYAGSGGTRTHQINLTSLAAAAARQGAKADMAVLRVVKGGESAAYKIVPERWAVTLRIEMDVASADNKTVDLYWGASLSSVAATTNPGGLTGADAAYTGTAGGTLAEGLLQLQFIGSLAVQNDVAPVVLQQTFIATLPLRYGMPVVVNNSDQAFEGDAVEMSVTFTPLVDEDY